MYRICKEKREQQENISGIETVLILLILTDYEDTLMSISYKQFSEFMINHVTELKESSWSNRRIS